MFVFGREEELKDTKRVLEIFSFLSKLIEKNRFTQIEAGRINLLKQELLKLKTKLADGLIEDIRWNEVYTTPMDIVRETMSRFFLKYFKTRT